MLTYKRLREVLNYDAETGAFTHKFRTTQRSKIGAIAGSANSHGHWKIRIDGRVYYAHRLAWLYETGSWPKDQIDHINGNRKDNRFVNLREADTSENNHNAKTKKTNTSGFKGVSFDKKRGRWKSVIGVQGKQKQLGRFDTPEEAHAAYVKAAEMYYGEFARFG